jgi:uncharacterized protein (TIGR03067 family)
MATKLPARPNLDHLRRQAKALLADLAAGNATAATVLREHLSAAKKLTAEKILQTAFKLADAQAAIARQSGFAGWPHLARHVEQLRALEGEWAFERLEVAGEVMPGAALSQSRIFIDGDRFRTESPEANYEGIFNINVEADPHEIDLEFVAGPEAGNWNYGIFRVDGERLEICLDLEGKPRPRDFKTARGGSHAWEILQRVSTSRPKAVDGGNPPAAIAAPTAPAPMPAGFEFVSTPLLTRLHGEWSAVELVRDGEPFPAMMLRTGGRSATKNEVRISFGGQTIIHARVKFDETQQPIAVDYFHIGGMTKGALQLGVMKWIGDEACFCMAAPGQPRPADFECPRGSGRTLSRWKLRR